MILLVAKLGQSLWSKGHVDFLRFGPSIWGSPGSPISRCTWGACTTRCSTTGVHKVWSLFTCGDGPWAWFAWRVPSFVALSGMFTVRNPTAPEVALEESTIGHALDGFAPRHIQRPPKSHVGCVTSYRCVVALSCRLFESIPRTMKRFFQSNWGVSNIGGRGFVGARRIFFRKFAHPNGGFN